MTLRMDSLEELAENIRWAANRLLRKLPISRIVFSVTANSRLNQRTP
jgi:hypothetical protein